MKYVIRRQSFKAHVTMCLFITLISTLPLIGSACTKGASEPLAPSPDSPVPKETPREGAVEPTQSQDTTSVARPAPSKQPKDSIDMSSEVKSIGGITWQGDSLWVLDDERKIIDRFDTTLEELSPDHKYSIDLTQSSAFSLKKFKGLAYDKEAEALWVAAEETDIDPKKMVPMLIKINLVNRQTELIKMEIPAKKGFKSIEGIAWDKKRESLWVAIYAGFSSSLNQINPKTRQITKSIFSDSYPKGIATDGEHLWSICYNGEEFPSAIDQRIIQPEEHKMLRSREFIKDIPEAEPISLVFDGNDLWYADKKTKRVIRFIQPNKKPLQLK
ncbi:MAG: hypothetical protein B6D35_10540 [Candidatus Brocadia sp. UTAMX2]|uniref:Uncharacterized protein n=1 Tax=Candidatus Brocadia fulgida TaxID=380242 RepID=A0A0M2USJ1_9BACT|nr:MAG: hypothetical protein BROFUL_03354 [Candidatus Brocadia fulgida]OQY99026.1 MAG: hypothetical protein B6D35_10540 [Candidatus Brocadia sp. UTAMX2]